MREYSSILLERNARLVMWFGSGCSKLVLFKTRLVLVDDLLVRLLDKLFDDSLHLFVLVLWHVHIHLSGRKKENWRGKQEKT